MSKKCIFMVFVCLLGISSYALGSGSYDFQGNWRNTTNDATHIGATHTTNDWFDGNNWGNQSNGNGIPVAPPDMSYWAAMDQNPVCEINALSPWYGLIPKWPAVPLNPSLTHNCSYNTGSPGARASQLFIDPWAWTGKGVQQVIVHSGDFNSGQLLGLCNMLAFNSTTDGYAQLDVNGGTVYTGGTPNVLDWNFPCDLNETNLPAHSDWQTGTGLQLGSSAGANWGVVNINAGQVLVQRINIYYGDINVLGGLLYQTDPCSTYLSISLSKPRNRINIGGGELRIKGDNRDRVNYYVGKGKILAYENRGMLSVDFNGTDTVVTAEGSVANAWMPNPTHQKVNVSLTPTLTWNPGDYVQETQGHQVYLGTNATQVANATTASAEFMGTQNNASYVVSTALNADTIYYWRVDEVNTADGNSPWTGWVWNFRTLGGSAVEPIPASGTVGLPVACKLDWLSGAFAVNHQLYISTSEANTTDATIGTAAGLGVTLINPASKPYSLSSLTWDLQKNTTYYWRVDEVNNSNPGSPWKGETWSFTNTNYLVVEDFNGYENADDMNVIWKTNFTNNCYGDISHCGLGYDNYSDRRVMQFSYDNTASVKYSEARLEANGGSAADWTGGGALPASDPVTGIAVKYLGASANSATQYDRLYLALEDTTGNFYVQSVPDGNATRNLFGWTEWNIKLTDLGTPTLNLASMRYLYLGSGDRVGCNIQFSGGTGTVLFDDIRLYQTHCVADGNAQVGDITGDCKVNYDDIDYMVNNWLVADTSATLAVSAPTTGPVAWYKFDETGGTTAYDTVHPEANNATVLNPGSESALWSPAGGFNGGCINLVINANTLVEIPPAVLNFLSTKKAFSMSIWVKMDYYAPTDSWARLISIMEPNAGAVDQEVLEFDCPTPRPPSRSSGPEVLATFRTADSNVTDGNISGQMLVSDFANQWNNYIIVKNTAGGADGNTIRVYHNGFPIIEPNHTLAPLPTPPLTSLRLGCRLDSIYEQHWIGSIDDFRVYDYALTAAQAAYIGTNATGSYSHPMTAAGSVANIYTADTPGQRVNFRDYSVIASKWLQQTQWP